MFRSLNGKKEIGCPDEHGCPPISNSRPSFYKISLNFSDEFLATQDSKSQPCKDSFVQNIWGDYYGVVYILTDNNLDKNLPYNMNYIGQTIQRLEKRFYDHLHYPPNKYLGEAVSRYHNKLEIISIGKDAFQTIGGEFTIRVLKKCNTLRELDETEKLYIKKYKTSILDHYYYNNRGIRMPLYGYNVTRGGGGYPSITGDIHHSFKHINKELLKDLLIEGVTADEIARELEISLPTLIDKVKFFWAKEGINSISEARIAFGGRESYLRRVGKAGNSVVGVELNEQELIRKIKEGLFMRELEMYFHVSHSSITNALKELGYNNLTDCREKLGVIDLFRQRQKIFKDRATLRGDQHQDYVEIELEELRLKIMEDIPAEDVAAHFGVSMPTILSRLKEFWSFKNFKEAQIFFIIQPKIDRIIKKNISQEFYGSSNEEIEAEYLKELIYLKCNKSDLAQTFRFGRQGIKNYLNEILKMDFKEANLYYYWKPKIISGFMQNLKISQAIRLLEISTHFVYLGYIWNEEFMEFGQNNNEVYNFLKRIYNYYPKIDLELLERLQDQGFKGKKIDLEFRRKFAPFVSSAEELHLYMENLAYRE